MSIIAASGPPNWARVVLPAGRSRQACTSAYNRLLKEASTIPMGDGAQAGTASKRASPNKSKDNGTATKRKRGSKANQVANGGVDDDEEEGLVIKKQKKQESEQEELKGEDEDDEGAEELTVKKETADEEDA